MILTTKKNRVCNFVFIFDVKKKKEQKIFFKYFFHLQDQYYFPSFELDWKDCTMHNWLRYLVQLIRLLRFFYCKCNESAIKRTDITDYYAFDSLQHDLFSIINVYLSLNDIM